MSEQVISPSATPENRRDSDRKKLIVDVRFEGGDGTGIANTRDIGVGGLYMTTGAALDIGSQILMAMSVGGKDMRINGTVVYTDPGLGVGVRFNNISDADLTILSGDISN